ncbi:MAG TPA: triphosphoribosyl-dephospho-CoA synthase [Gemmatimonadales bacterium]|jgi:triphosphoribosyl-dephospho-CoA synthase|nr:triphosphoribosyl-dephospho-CoA synthase [Gemmatimonadales bacterium]
MTRREVGAAAQLACLLEVSAPKPGNVSPGLHFHDTSYEDFLASAVAIGPVMAEAGDRPLGTIIREAIAATRRVTGRNTNLGIVLLLAPLCRAALVGERALRPTLQDVLASTTVADAAEVYAAIRLVSPAGLGAAAAQDVARAPTVTLRAAMALAAERDSVAREYVTDFGCTFELGAPTLRAARKAGLSWADAVVETFLALLAATPDSHIARKLGSDAAHQVTRRAQAVREAGGVRTAAGRTALAALDRELRDDRNQRNPGTTADLTAAAIAVVILEDGWTLSGEHDRAQ